MRDISDVQYKSDRHFYKGGYAYHIVGTTDGDFLGIVTPATTTPLNGGLALYATMPVKSEQRAEADAQNWIDVKIARDGRDYLRDAMYDLEEFADSEAHTVGYYLRIHDAFTAVLAYVKGSITA